MQVYIRTRGRELPGNSNSALLSELFYEQSQRWYSIGNGHIESILAVVSQWVKDMASSLIAEDHLQCEIRRILMASLETAKQLALEELDKLICDERRSPLTYNHYYTDNVQKARLDGQRAAVRTAIAQVTNEDHHGKLHISNLAEDIERFITATQSKL